MIVKLHLEFEEHEALQRYAEGLGVTDEDIAYASLHRLMLAAKDSQEEIDRDIVATRNGRRANLPLWSDSAQLMQLHESLSSTPSTPSLWPR